jgi:hypothetical protein
MKVGHLRAILQDLPYDTEIVVEGRNDIYRKVTAEHKTALLDKDNNIIEDYYTDQDTFPVWYTGRINVLLVK